MALSAGLGNSPNSPTLSRFGSGIGVEAMVRTLLVVYLAAVVVLHVVTMPTVFENLKSACPPGQCFPGQLTQDSLDQLSTRGISPVVYAIVATLIPLLIPIFGHTLAAVAIWQRPTNWLLVMFVMGMALCTISASGALGIVLMKHPDWEQRILLIHVPMLIAGTLLTLLFPTGKLIPKWGILLMGFVVLDFISVFFTEQFMTWPAIFHDALNWWLKWGELLAIGIIAWRIHVTTDRRALRQTKVWFAGQIPWWIFFVMTTFVLAADNGNLWDGSLLSIATYFGWAVAVLSTITGFLIAVYLYNVYDLSMVIRRSIVYILLSIALIGLYLLTVAVISTVFRDDNSAVPAILATAIIALALAPLRDWLQRVVRQLMFGDENDPYGVLSRFGRQLEETSAPERLLRSVVELAQDTLRVPGVALAVDNAPNLGVVTGSVSPAAPSVPVRYQGEAVGTMTVTPRSPGESFSPADHRLIDEIARQMGIAVHSVLLSEDLRHSRERIVTAREEERRRIRRDLHDGLGPSLAALSLQVEIARDLIATDPHRSSELLDDVLGQTRESILDIRRLVYELRPPALDDLGLVGAIRAQAMTWERGGLTVTLDLDDNLPVGSAATEVAIYRIVQEAMTNVLRHSAATAVDIRLTANADTIQLEIDDNGQGLPISVQPGVGLVSMRERAAELGGTCDVTASWNGGTRVVATFRASESRDD